MLAVRGAWRRSDIYHGGASANFEINLSWTIAVLVLAIIAILVWEPTSDVLFQYISFASAISSIVLALVAIFYSIISNSAFNSTVSEIKISADRVAQEAARLNQASAGLSTEAEDIIRRLSGLPTAISQMSGQINEKLEGISSQRTFAEDTTGKKAPADKFDPAGKPIPVVIALYTMYLAEKHNKYLDLSKLFNSDGDEFYKSYLQGFVDSLKYFNKCNVVIEGVLATYSIESMGDLDLSYLAHQLENSEKIDEGNLAIINRLRADFDEDPLKSSAVNVENNTEG